jgi:hypothetical protein
MLSVMTDFSAAIAHAQAHEVPWPRDPAADPEHWGVHQVDPPPFNRLRGPVHPRGGVSGVIRIDGREVAAWGEPDRADLTYSVAKTYLALLAGVANARGLLPDPQERIAARLPGIGFDDGHNRSITWAQMLEQTSEWQGSSFGVPDTVDHNRRVSHDPKPPAGAKGEPRPLRAPGTYWEYNDVRINQLSLALLHLFGRPLPEVFEEAVLLADVTPAQARAAWAALREGPRFDELLAPSGLRLAASALQPWSRWITPALSSVGRKRFDTRFFLATVPPGQEARHDDHEATESLWLAPRAALRQYWDGAIELAPPQILGLSHLARHRSVASVLAAAASCKPPCIRPEPRDAEGLRVLCYPGDPWHSEPRRALPGPTRLTWRNKRFEPDAGLAILLGD